VGLLEEYARWGIRIFTLWDEGYPARLRQIATPPLVLMVQGTAFPGDHPVAVVGTRQPSQAGQTMAQVFAMHLARNGHAVVSGLARGIDTRAHVGALSVGGTTLAILPGHLGKVYPPENRELFMKIRESGALVSEVTQFVPLHRGRFIERNRITSGLSEATVIAEFHGSGGTFQQGKFALSQGRPLFVIDLGESAGPKASAGIRQLVQMGARSVKTPEELLSEIESSVREPLKPKARKSTVQAKLAE
jgi:DNA processing protein